MKFGRAVLGVLAALTVAVVVPTTAGASESAGPGDYCVQDLAGGPEVCFGTARELDAYQEENALSPLVTMFRDINYTGGYKNYVSAYGRDYCDGSVDYNEASDGDLRPDRYSTGGTLDRTISSFVIKSGSRCLVRFYDGLSFTGGYQGLTQSCPDMRNCALED